ncbi:unknown [Firmicutes bacterium CAG:103]|nr:unknown [Firmicutes bacterium CAG:103]
MSIYMTGKLRGMASRSMNMPAISAIAEKKQPSAMRSSSGTLANSHRLLYSFRQWKITIVHAELTPA